MSRLLQLAAAREQSQSTVKMYSSEGASFQEWAIAYITASNKTNNPIGTLVTLINNDKLTVGQAKAQFLSFLSNNQ